MERSSGSIQELLPSLPLYASLTAKTLVRLARGARQIEVAKGAVLFDPSDKYMVHASRREKPGMAEIHTLDADIVHVLDGTATLVTGQASLLATGDAAPEPRREVPSQRPLFTGASAAMTADRGAPSTNSMV